MLIALITFLLLGGPDGRLTAIKDYEKQIKVVVPKGETQGLALAVLKEARTETKAFNKSRKNATKEFSKLVESHEVDPDKIDELWSDYHQANFNFNMQNVELRFRLKQHLSREQWSQVFSAKPQ
jgi:hypothetical protein